MREMGGAIIDFQGGHADALSNKPNHTKDFSFVTMGRRSWWQILSNALFFYQMLQMQCMVCITGMHGMIYQTGQNRL